MFVPLVIVSQVAQSGAPVIVAELEVRTFIVTVPPFRVVLKTILPQKLEALVSLMEEVKAVDTLYVVSTPGVPAEGSEPPVVYVLLVVPPVAPDGLPVWVPAGVMSVAVPPPPAETPPVPPVPLVNEIEPVPTKEA